MIETFIHSNGGGRIIGSDGAISSDSVLDKTSYMEGRTFVAFGSSITKSIIKDSTINLGDVRESVVVNSHISAALVYDSALEGAVIRGTKERSTVVQGCILSRKVVIEACTVRGIDLSGPYLLHADWNRTPRHHLLTPCDGVQMGISECSSGGDRGHCGCRCRPYSEWIEEKETLRKIFVRRGWSRESIDIVHQYFEEWRRSRVRLAVA